MSHGIVTASYIGATILFILALGGLSHPETSRRGNLYGIIGMAIALVATIAGITASPASSIIIIGALLQIGSGEPLIMWLAGLAVLITAINISGGFAVTRRMLEMFRK